MSKFAMIVALMLVSGFDAYCLYTFPPTDAHFTYAAYLSGAIAALLTYLEFFHVIYNGITDALESRRRKRVSKSEPAIAPTEITPSTTADTVVR